MNILVINSGSSTIKYNIYTETLEKIFSGRVDRIGAQDTCLYHKSADMADEAKQVRFLPDHKTSLDYILNETIPKDIRQQIYAVGHRVVLGGEQFNKPALVNDFVKSEIKRCFDLAPLHNPHNLAGILAIEQVLPDVPNVACFDTAFHQTIPVHAYLYGIPYNLYKKHGIRRYGFHGTSHQYVTEQTAELLKVPLNKVKLITCHLGNGCSITAVKNGKSIDTSMGFTPLEGLIMGTRCGNIDPSIVTFLMAAEGLSINEVNNLMNKSSGLYGVSAVSNDMRTLCEEMDKGNDRAKLAVDMFCYSIKKYIGSYCAVLDSVDAVVFAGGIGENSHIVRKKTCENLAEFGIEIDDELNKKRGQSVISKQNTKIKVMVVPTNEELMIARQTKEILEKK
jgi:acetate kinase